MARRKQAPKDLTGIRQRGGRYQILWVPNRSSASCDLGIFVDQPTKAITALDT
jgi:hypothetical protein